MTCVGFNLIGLLPCQKIVADCQFPMGPGGSLQSDPLCNTQKAPKGTFTSDSHVEIVAENLYRELNREMPCAFTFYDIMRKNDKGSDKR